MEEDLELTLKDLLLTNWNLDGELDKKKMKFHRNMRKVEGTLTEPNVITNESVDVNIWDKEGMAECLASIIVRTRIQAKGTTNESVDEAKILKMEMRTEVYRILKAVSDGTIDKPDGWEWAHITRRVNGDNFDFQPALFGEDLFVTIAYQRSG